MRVLLLDDELYEFLKFLIRKHVAQGFEEELLEITTALSKTVNEAKTIDFSKLGKADLTALGSKGVKLDLPDIIDPIPDQFSLCSQELSIGSICGQLPLEKVHHPDNPVGHKFKYISPIECQMAYGSDDICGAGPEAKIHSAPDGHRFVPLPKPRVTPESENRGPGC